MGGYRRPALGANYNITGQKEVSQYEDFEFGTDIKFA
jgi:hypothetical protein